MRDILRKLNYIFDKKQKRSMFLLLIAIFLGAAAELVGVSLIMPLIQLISTPEVVEENPLISTVYKFLNMHSLLLNHYQSN